MIQRRSDSTICFPHCVRLLRGITLGKNDEQNGRNKNSIGIERKLSLSWHNYIISGSTGTLHAALYMCTKKRRNKVEKAERKRRTGTGTEEEDLPVCLARI